MREPVIAINFSHPLTPEQCAQIESKSGASIERIIDVPTQFDDGEPFGDQLPYPIAHAGLTAEEWQTLPLIVNPPSYSPITAVLLAYLHGLMGHFPTVIRLRPRADSLVPRYDLAEVISLDCVRHEARRGR